MPEHKKIVIISALLSLLFLNGSGSFCFAQLQPPTGQIERSNELIEKEEALRKKLETPEKVYIEDILLEGAVALTKDQIKEITLPYQKRWLTKADIQQLIELVKEAYRQKGYAEKSTKISYKVKKKNLVIRVKELTH